MILEKQFQVHTKLFSDNVESSIEQMEREFTN